MSYLCRGVSTNRQPTSYDPDLIEPSQQEAENNGGTECYVNYMERVPADEGALHTVELLGDNLRTPATSAGVPESSSFDVIQLDEEHGQKTMATCDEATSISGSIEQQQQHTATVTSIKRAQLAITPHFTGRLSTPVQQIMHLQGVIRLNRLNGELEAVSLQQQKRPAEAIEATARTAAGAAAKIENAADRLMNFTHADVATIEKFGYLADALIALTQVQTEQARIALENANQQQSSQNLQ